MVKRVARSGLWKPSGLLFYSWLEDGGYYISVKSDVITYLGTVVLDTLTRSIAVSLVVLGR